MNELQQKIDTMLAFSDSKGTYIINGIYISGNDYEVTETNVYIFKILKTYMFNGELHKAREVVAMIPIYDVYSIDNVKI